MVKKSYKSEGRTLSYFRKGLVLLCDLLVFNSDSIFLTEFYAGKTSMALVTVYRKSFVFNEFVDFSWTPFDTFVTTGTFFFLNGDVPHGAVS